VGSAEKRKEGRARAAGIEAARSKEDGRMMEEVLDEERGGVCEDERIG
jgi:hypothetical protein